MSNNLALHNHPKMEKEKGIDSDHVIIDRAVYDQLMRKLGPKFSIKNIREYTD